MEKSLMLQAQTEMVAQEFPKVANRQWAEPENERDFLEGITGLVHAKANGFDNQVDLYKMECLDIIHADLADHALALAKKNRLKTVRHFTNHPVTNNKEFKVVGKGKFDWVVKPVNKFENKIPIPALETLSLLRQNGVDPDGFGIGEAVEKPTKHVSKPRWLDDPVLLIRFGRFWLEVARWS